MEYELLYSGNVDDNQLMLMGLVDAEKLQYDKKKLGLNGTKLGSSWHQVSPKLDAEKLPQANGHAPLHELQKDWVENAYLAV
jgi:hypothetical protein